jgi:TatD DNase family protein
MLIDTHCHVDRFPDASALASKCEASGIMTVAVTNIPSHYESARPHLNGMKYVVPALGFHPMAVGENQRELPLFLRLAENARFIGEVGLDFSQQGEPTKTDQIRVFSAIIEAVAKHTGFVTMHSRGAADEVLETLKRFDFHRAVFHWFSGSGKCLEKAIDWGCWFSVNTAMIGSQSGRDVISRLPKDRVLTETDGPYVRLGRRPAEPSDMRMVVAALASFWSVSVKDAEAQVCQNFQMACGERID